MKHHAHAPLACCLAMVIGVPLGPDTAAQTSPDSTGRIVLALRDGEDTNLYIGDPLSGVRPLTHDGISDLPVWSPDGREIAFVSSMRTDDAAGLSGMYTTATLMVLNPANGDMRALTSFDRMITPTIGNPAWSPDGKRIAFSYGGIGQEPNLYLVNADGTNLHALTNSEEYADRTPSWSPDGQCIAFQRKRDERGQVSQVYIIPAAGGKPTRLAQGADPAWAPDGRSVTLVVRNGSALHGDSVAQIVTVDIETGDVRRLGKPLYDVRSIRWSPNGRHLGLTGIRKEPEESRAFSFVYHYRPYLLSADGTDLRLLLDRQVDTDTLCWSPDASQVCLGTQVGHDDHTTLRIVDSGRMGEQAILGAESDGTVACDWGAPPTVSIARFAGTWAGQVAINDRVFPIEVRIQERDGRLIIVQADGPQVPCDLTGPMERADTVLRRSVRLPDLEQATSRPPFYVSWSLTFDASDTLVLEERISADRPRFDGPAFPVYELRPVTSLATHGGPE